MASRQEEPTTVGRRSQFSPHCPSLKGRIPEPQEPGMWQEPNSNPCLATMASLERFSSATLVIIWIIQPLLGHCGQFEGFSSATLVIIWIFLTFSLTSDCCPSGRLNGRWQRVPSFLLRNTKCQIIISDTTTTSSKLK